MQNPFSLSGQVAVITGGASGLGFEIARAMTTSGAKVVILGTREEEQLREACKQIGGETTCFRYDVTQTQQAQEMIDRILRDCGKIDVLINNAGVHCKKTIEETTIEDFDRVQNTHVRGSFALTRAVIPHMRKQKQGNILFVSSMSAYFALDRVVAYSAAKSAVQGMVRTIAGEVSQDGIRVNAIAPGFIDTPMFRQATDGDPARKTKILGRTPMGRFGEADEIGWAAVFLCSPAASFITGVCLPVDGGCSIGF